ncbi:MAG: glycosyltransferase family 39 protein [Chitinophaga sp.]|uniref:glycosyltransferase family 39 protein n=1 Tax=Chitinophaga sp. TaxID=1869181 RepID=UPI001B125F96|nr:glycosyltransferase family 39 protein [Chitinophaga sp.]MBO9729091.1 glycosyltransferase family 39 protein [Chitinophaga sp.]
MSTPPLTSPLHRSPIWLLLLIVLVKMAFQFGILSPDYDLQRDEYLHLDLANHLAAGFLSVPPFTAITSLVIQWLGNGFFWIRFFPALYGALTMVLVWKMVEMLGGRWFAQVLAALVFICSGMSRVNILYQPNSFDILAWTLLFWCFLKWLHSGSNKWLLWMGVITGIGILNKYNILFLIVGLLGSLLLSSHRQVFKNKYLYVGAAIALLMISPNMIWQLQHGWPVLHHMQELTETQLVHVNRMTFITDQFIFFIGGAFIVVAAFIGLLFYRPFRPYRIVLLIYVLTMLLFTYLRAKSYYSLGLYPVLLAFGSVYWERIFTHDWTRHLRWLWVAIIVVPFALLVNVVFPVLGPTEISEKAAKFRALGLLRWEDGEDHALPQDFADMLGWHQLAGMALQAWEQVPATDKPYTLVITSNYGEAGALNYYNKGKMPLAVSFDADYVYWFPKMDSIRYLLKVGKRPQGETLKLAGKIVQTGVLQDTLSREYGYGADVYLLSDLSPALPARLKEVLLEKQGEYEGRAK